MKKTVPLLRLPYSEAEIEEIKQQIEEILKSGFLTMAGRVQEFERQFALFCRTRYALATNSGTSALEIALRGVGVEGGTVVMPSNTYMATPLAAIKAGASAVIFTDCLKQDLQMDPDDLSKKIRKDTRAVVVVHIGGIVTQHIDRIRSLCEQRGIPLIEDAAHAHGAVFNGRVAGEFGVAAAFSFYPTKVLTSAEGGMLVTDDVSLYEKGVIMREHGKADHGVNVHVEIGDNWRFSELHAVLGLQQMKKAAYILSERRRLAALYERLLTGCEWLKPVKMAEGVDSAYYKYIAFLPEHVDRQQLKSRLQEEFGVQLSGEVYSHPCHSQPLFQKYPEKLANSREDRFPNTDYVCRHHVCLPLYPGLQDDEVHYVVECLRCLLD